MKIISRVFHELLTKGIVFGVDNYGPEILATIARQKMNNQLCFLRSCSAFDKGRKPWKKENKEYNSEKYEDRENSIFPYYIGY